MDEKTTHERESGSSEVPVTTTKQNAWPWVAVLLLCCAVVITLAFFFREQDSRRQLAAANTQMSTDLSQMHDEVQSLNARVSALMATPPAQPVVSTAPASSETPASATWRAAKHTAARHVAKYDPRWKQMQSALNANKEQIDATSQDVAKTRSELQDNLNSAKDELGGSIARTHDELVALEKRGERSYFEFNVVKSKGFERVGPLNLSLRKTNTKNGFYDMAILVEDSKLNKKHVNLFEPMLFYPSDSHQPLELVVNRIDKNSVRGYVSAPKFKESETAVNASTGDPSKPPPDTKVDLARRTDGQQ